MADAGKVTVPDFDLELNALGETIIKLGQAAPVTPLLNDVAVDQVAKSLQSAAKGLEGLSIPTSLADMPDIAKELSGEIN